MLPRSIMVLAVSRIGRIAGVVADGLRVASARTVARRRTAEMPKSWNGWFAAVVLLTAAGAAQCPAWLSLLQLANVRSSEACWSTCDVCTWSFQACE
jgi:hypothetical protein